MLEQFVVSQLFAFFLIFCRVGSAILLLPGFGETYVSRRIRLTFALVLSLMLTPLLLRTMPPVPVSTIDFTRIIVFEILTGLFIGSLCNVMASTMHIAGMIVSFQSGMSSAVVYDVTQESQGSLIGNFLGILVIVLLFATDLDHLMLRGLAESYRIFVPGKMPPLNDFVEAFARLLSDTFIVAVQISAPLIVGGTLLFLGGGILSRLMPTMQVFYIIIPPQLLVSFFILTTTFSGIMLWYMEFYREKLTGILSYIQ